MSDSSALTSIGIIFGLQREIKVMMMKKESYTTATPTKINSEAKKKQQANSSKIEKPKFQYEKIKFFSERDLMELMSD